MEEDPRFSHIVSDPKFRHIPKGSRKVKIDERFKSMFNNKHFSEKYSVDKRGRPISHTSKEDLRRYYELSSEESDSEDDDDSSDSKQPDDTTEETGKFVRPPKNDDEKEQDDLSQKHKSDKRIPDTVKQKLKNLSVDYARGESNLFSESSSDDDESEEEEGELEGDVIDHKWGELDADAATTEEVTHRLAACNMDWDRIRAIDLMVLFNSFISAGSTIESVVIYPSEFGKQRMKEEEIKGPIELVEAKKQKGNEEEDEDKEEEENEEGSKYHMEKLRQYQLNRLKYYYAVITFDSPGTANKVYTECDGMEYESTATKLDLRFIPDHMTFDDEPKEVCKQLPDMSKYQPRFFTTTALQQARVDLTWDETNPDRIELTQKLNSGKIDDIEDADLQDYLASSTDGEESDENTSVTGENDDTASTADPISKYRNLLLAIEENEKKKQEKDVQMEVRWDLDLIQKSEKLVKQKMKEKIERTPFEEYIDKRKEKKKEKKKQKQSQHDEEGSGDDSDIPDGVDMNDPYFAEEFDNPEFKKKSKRKANKKDGGNDDNEEPDKDLELLVWNEDDDNDKHFNFDKIQEQDSGKKKKKKRQKKNEANTTQDSFNVNVNDERFAALFTSHYYNIDPTHPQFKKTKAMETLIDEKLKRRNQSSDDTLASKKAKIQEKKNPDLSLLVKSVTQKTIAFNKNKNKMA